MVIYFVFVLGIGFALKRHMKTSTDFFLSGRSIPAWITGLAFISANLGAQEVIGMGASGAKYGIATSHFYWVGAIPAMVFVGVFMMPFYYGSRARSVPEYLKLRFDEKTRGLERFAEVHELSFSKPDGSRVVRDGYGLRVRLVVRLLVHGFSGRTKGDGRQVDVSSATNSFDCRDAENVLSVSCHPARHDCD